MSKSGEQTINVALTENQWSAILRTIGMRQRECQSVTSEFKQHEKFAKLDVEYEKLKMNIVAQIS